MAVLEPKARRAQHQPNKDDYSSVTADGAMRPLKKPLNPPPEFICPLSGHLMIDPVIISSSGVTFERLFIENWLKDGNWTCPQTGQLLFNTTPIPNLLIKEIISNWCVEQGIQLPTTQQDVDEETTIANPDRRCLSSLLEKLFRFMKKIIPLFSRG
ncbi:hypothetical protein ACH5RR_018733 [Cinchona calisaya]|uniref:U-box domain-containing protein n=1 Tax=Cinchona calisaya TaxID=153742 RepID=A0ABD2ZMR0_9GENT